MQSTLSIAAIQLNARESRNENVDRAVQLVERAAEDGAEVVVLPELFNGYVDLAAVVAEAEPIPGPTSQVMQSLAARCGIYLVAGSICEQASTLGRGYNTSLVFGPDGAELARYRKLHLFDAQVPGSGTVCESQAMLPGSAVVSFSSPLAEFGLAICYDLRFPELFRELSRRGMEVLLFPSAFTQATGKDHWEVLLRARAIENQCYVVAANQCGEHSPRSRSFGHSMIVDPWGRILAEAGDEEAIVQARLDGVRLRSVREVLPALKNLRLP